MALTSIHNHGEAIEASKPSADRVRRAHLETEGDYTLGILEFPAEWRQKPHYHQFGDIDIFIVVAGTATLYLARHESNKILSESIEQYHLKPGDTYAIKPQVVHFFETHGCPFRVMNIAQPQHTTLTPMTGTKAYDITYIEWS